MRGIGERLGIGAAAREVAGGHRGAEVGRGVAAGVFQQRDEVVGGMAPAHVLVVEQADPGEAAAAGQPDEVLGMVVAQHRDRGRGEHRGGEAADQGGQFGVAVLPGFRADTSR
jgi:hypothetical protein